MRLLLVRHGETHLNVKRRFLGQLDDELTPTGELQAESLAERLADETLDAVISSDLQRAYKTAEAIARRHGLVVQTDSRLREISMGVWEGVSVAEVEAREAALMARWRADPIQYYPVGGESLVDLESRIRLSLASWQERYQASEKEPALVWVTHGAFIHRSDALHAAWPATRSAAPSAYRQRQHLRNSVLWLEPDPHYPLPQRHGASSCTRPLEAIARKPLPQMISAHLIPQRGGHR